MARPKTRRGRGLPTQGTSQGFSGYHRLLFIITFIYIALVIYSFTPYTHNLDEIKVSVLYLGGSLLLCLYLFFAAQGFFRLFPPIPLLPLAGYFAVLFISTLLAGKTYSWIGWIQIGFHISLLGGFFCCFGLMRSPRDVNRALFWYMLFGLGTTIFGLFHYAGGFAFLHKLLFPDENVQSPIAVLFLTFMGAQDEMFSTILNRQFYAAFLVMIMPLATAYAIVEEKSHLWRYVSIAALILMAICLYLAHSKASTGATVVTAFVFLVLYKLFAKYKEIRIPHLGVWLAGFLVIALTLGVFTADIGPEKFKTIHRSVASRTIIWGGGWDMFLHGSGQDNWYEQEEPLPLSVRSMLVGCGPGTFRLIFPRYRSPDYHLHDISNVTLFSHNRFLDLLAENGILGFLFYMTFLFLFVFLGIKRLLTCKDGPMRVYIIGLLCSFFGLYLSNIFSPNSRWAVVATNLWAILGLGFGAFEVAAQRQDSSQAQAKGGKKEFSPAVHPPRVSNILLVLILLFLPITFFCWRFGIRRFQGAMANNQGLTYSKMGEAFIIESEKLQQLSREKPELREQIKRNLSYYQRSAENAYRIAIESFHKALKYNPLFITSYYKLAHAYNCVGEVDRSFEVYQQLQTYAPDYSEVHFNLGVVLTSLAQTMRREMLEGGKGQSQEKLMEIQKLEEHSLEEFRIAAKMSNKATVQERYAQKLIMAGKYKEAGTVYETLNRLDPSEIEYLRMLAFLSENLKDEASAVKYYTLLFQKDPTNEQFPRRIELYYQKLDQPEKYEEFLIESTDINPLDPRPRLKLIDLYVRKKDAANIRKQLGILMRLPELPLMIGRDTPERQKNIYNLSKIAAAAEYKEAEVFFLKECVRLDDGTSIGVTCSRLLKRKTE